MRWRNFEKRLLALSYSVCTFVSLCVCPCVWNNWASTGRAIVNFHIWVSFENLFRKFPFQYNLTRVPGTLYENLCTFMITYRWILLWMRNISEKKLYRNSKHTLYAQFFPPRKLCSLWNNVEKCCRARGCRRKNNMRPVSLLMDSYGYRHKLSMCHTYRFSMANIVPRRRLHINSICTLPVLLDYLNF